MNENINAIVFDLGGTLRIALKDKEWMRQGRINMAELAGTDLPFDEFVLVVKTIIAAATGQPLSVIEDRFQS